HRRRQILHESWTLQGAVHGGPRLRAVSRYAQYPARPLEYDRAQEDRCARLDPDQGIFHGRQDLRRCTVHPVPDRDDQMRYCGTRQDTLPGRSRRSYRAHCPAQEARCRGQRQRQCRGGAVIDDALAALRDGKFILLYDFDDREGETDFAIRSDAVTPRDIVRMRKDGGGLICTAVHPVAAQRLGLPFASDALRATAVAEREGDIPYDRKNHSSFSLWVNHRNTFTGITDRDRTLTVNAIAEQVKRALNGGGENFHEIFRTPGHMALLRAADGLLDVRRGQTEL